MVTFYHVSTNKIKTGDTIKRTMTPAKWRIDRGYTKDFACLAFNINHAKFWVKVLSQSPKENGSWYIYKVQLPAKKKSSYVLTDFITILPSGLRAQQKRSRG